MVWSVSGSLEFVVFDRLKNTNSSFVNAYCSLLSAISLNPRALGSRVLDIQEVNKRIALSEGDGVRSGSHIVVPPIRASLLCIRGVIAWMIGIVKTPRKYRGVAFCLQYIGLLLPAVFRFMPNYACHYDVPLKRPEMLSPLWKAYPCSNQLREGLKHNCPDNQSANAKDECPPAAAKLVVRG